MKKLFNLKSRKKGFSLVELIVVIAIMAVLVAILAPSLLSYTERSRSQKDDSAMSEVTNAMLLGLSDADAYNEALEYSNPSNVSCYVDNNTEAGRTPILTKAATGQIKTQYTFGDDERLADETPYFAGGNMRGLTITFEPVQGEGNQTKYVLEDGVINKFVGTKGRLGDTVHLYNLVRQTVGNDIILASQTYRNSEYTIFIKLGTTGGAQSTAQDAIEVYGQYSGTNLPVTDAASYGMTVDRNAVVDEKTEEDDFFEKEETANHNGPEIPEGAIYGHISPSLEEIIYDAMPETVSINDFYIYGDYKYIYEENWYGTVGFSVFLNAETNKTSYGEILSSINGEPVNNISCLFSSCAELETAPEIPDSVIYMELTFSNCTSLVVAPEIPDSVTVLAGAFESCTSLTTVPRLSNNNPDMLETFIDCTALVEAPIIPEGVTSLERTFAYCTSLTTVPYLPESLEEMCETFANCESLINVPVIPSNVRNTTNTFEDCYALEGVVIKVPCLVNRTSWMGCRPTVEKYHVDGCGH